MATPAGQFRPWRLVAVFIAITAGLYALVFFTPGSNTPRLGIDLQGGTRITLTAQTSDGSTPSRLAMQQARDIMERRVNGSGVAGAQVQIDGSSQLIVTVPGTQDLANLTRSAQLNFRPVENLRQVVPTAVDTPSAGASGTADPSASASATGGTTADATTPINTAAVITKQDGTTSGAGVPPAGTTSTSATPTSQGLRGPLFAQETETPATAAETGTAADPSDGVMTANADPSAADATADSTGGTSTVDASTSAAAPAVTFPASSDPNVPTQPRSTEAADWTTWQNDMYGAWTAGLTCAQLAPYEGLDDTARPLVACDETGEYMYMLDAAIIPGDQIDTANAQLSQEAGWVVNLRFKTQGFNDWASYTAANVNTSVAFTLDGKVIIAPNIQGAITTDTQITGGFTQSEATGLANSLKFGALPLAFERSAAESVTAELGLSYLQAGLIAGGIGLLLVVLYCLIYYRLLGVITILSLLLSFGLVYAVMVLLGRWIGLSLDMAGVAGLIIAIGITADSFVVYFERIKDEVREGRSFRSAVPRGWVRARRTILSADAVSFLAAAILYVLAVGEVKGFAFTLGLSTVLDLVVVFLVTHPLVALSSGSKIFSSPRWSGLGAVAKAGAEQRAAVSSLSVKGS